MFTLSIVKGRQAGQRIQIDRYPFTVGSNSDADLCIKDEGVWVEHLTITLEPGGSPRAKRSGDGFVTINDEGAETLDLHQGDRIGIGGVQLVFNLSSVTRRNLAWLNVLMWTLIISIGILEVVLIYTLQTL